MDKAKALLGPVQENAFYGYGPTLIVFEIVEYNGKIIQIHQIYQAKWSRMQH